MAKGGGGTEQKSEEPAKRTIGETAEDAQSPSLIRRKGIRTTKMNRNSLGGGLNLGGR